MKQYRSSLHKDDKCKSKRILHYSGEFQEVESNYSGGLFHVSSQPAAPPDTWNTSGQQENVFGNQFSTVDSRNHYQGIHHFSTPGSTGPTKYCRTFCKLQAQGLFSQDMKIKNRGTIPMPTFAGRPSTMSYLRWIFSRIPWLDSKGSKYPNCNSSVHYNHFYVGIQDSKTKRLFVVDFHRKLCHGSTKWRWSVHSKNWNLRDQFVEGIFQTSRCWTRRLLLLWRRSSRIPFNKKVSLEEQKAQKKDRFLRGNLMRCFHVTMSPDLLTRQVLGNHFLMETRIICSIKQDLNELVRQEHQVGSLDNCIEELQQQAYAQRLELEDTQHGNIESRREQSRLREESSMKEKVGSEVHEKMMRHHKNSLLGCKKCKNRWILFRSHIGSRAISVQVSIVAVSDHVFHSSLLVSCSLCLHIFALASCLNRVLLIHLAHRFLTHPCSSRLRILVLLMALVPTSMVWAPALGAQRMKSSYTLKRRSRRVILNDVSSSSHIPTNTERLVAMYSHWRMSSLDVFRSLIPRESEFFFEHRETHDFLQWQADQAAQGEQAALSKICEAEYHTRLPLEEQKKPLSEARSEMNLQESRVESADRALRESRPQVWSDIVTVPQPLGLRVPWPGVIWWQNRDTRRRLHTFSSPGDEHVRTAVFLRFPCEH